MLYASSSRRKSRRRHANARRRGRRSLFGFNKRHRRSRRQRNNRAHRGRSYNKRHSRRGRRNPGAGGLSIRRPLSAVTAGFSPSVLMKAAPVVGGALGNAWLSGFLSSRLPLPGMLRSGPGSYVLSLGSAGLLGAGVGLVAPRFAAPVFFGGVLETVIRATQQYLVGPLLSRMSGLGDYLTVGDAAAARPLGNFGDYLTVGDAARARPLNGMSDFSGMSDTDSAISEELAAL